MDQSLVDRMWEYLNAGLAMDVEGLDALYDPGFENVRFDEEGRVVTLTKDQFMARFRALRDQGMKVGESLDDLSLLATSVYDGHGSIIVRRVKDDVPVLYNFVWRRQDGRWTTLVREFTFHKDITDLVRMIESQSSPT
ncbi:nuclear transport factor 2 family protein [Streptomyces solicathayae]|uniref:Nuclear transport factor 2 family protein n=1 Tax=Streptomyces solicathayae TaxID=3081768 RepID=A0ABZ0LW62_9ACTN|nr:nuclear transport factor 2 family protein [Streptomyces sp. HUAS YS2]WOX23739.1 nuclear transport factor 2 family protein [Streptomyces sp. HUAS YS2]